MNRVISGPGLVRCKTKNAQESAEVFFPFFVRMKALVTTVMENRENADAEQGSQSRSGQKEYRVDRDTLNRERE